MLYLSCLIHVDGVVGNSSSGLCEVPSFKKGTINIGDRQLGRLCASSVIGCEPNKLSIVAAIKKLYSEEFRANLRNVINPYGNGGSSELIVNIIEKYPLTKILKKKLLN